MTVTSGRKWQGLLRTYNLSGPLARTSEALLNNLWGSRAAFLTWKASGTASSHLLFQLVPSMHSTEGIEFGLWPTPTTQEIEHPDMQLSRTGRRLTKDKKNSHSLNLADSVKMWPTPRAAEWKGTGPLGSKSHKHRLAKSYLDATVQEAEQITGQLNPAWVEWLMGYEIGHTDLKPSEMPSSRKSSRKSGAQSSRRNNNETR